MDTCANCGGPIGKLEPPYCWDERTVCAGCYAKLKQAADLASTTIPYATPVGRRINRWWILVGVGAAVAAFLLTFGFFLTSMTVVSPSTPASTIVSTPAAAPPIVA